MVSVSVLYINDNIVGPHIELLRRISEPGSRSKPHITIRYFEKLSIPENHLSTQVDYIDLLEPGSFGLTDEWSHSNRTVFFRCDSEQLIALEHKPHFPTSFFHITIYDGNSIEFAKNLLNVLNQFDWKIRIPLPKGTTLSQIELKPHRSRTTIRKESYPSSLATLFQEITSLKLNRSLIEGYSDNKRLDIANLICKHLQMRVKGFKRVKVALEDIHQKAEDVNSGKTEVDVHLTPPELALEIAKYAVELLPAKTEIHFGDPAVGNGSFYGALLQVVPRYRISSAIGTDINNQQVLAARSRWAQRGMIVKHGDYLHMAEEPQRNLILANPPYLKHQGIPENYKRSLRERSSVELGIKVSGMSGLYVYFLLLSHKWMSQGAVAAWLIPSEFMQTNYGKSLRYYFTHEVQLLRVHRFDFKVPQFERVDVLPSVVVFRNRKPSSSDKVLFSLGGSLTKPTQSDYERLVDLQTERVWRSPLKIINEINKSEYIIGDLFKVKRGVATGANKFFIIKRKEAQKLNIPSEALRPILPKSRFITSDVVERAPDGYPVLDPQLCLIDSDMPEEKIRSQYPSFSEYLDIARREGYLERNLIRKRTPWYHQEKRLPTPFLCTYMGRGRKGVPPIRFIWNKSDAITTNTYLMLYPHQLLANLLTKEPSLKKELFTLLQETALKSMKGKLRIYAGGLKKIEPRELLQIPLAYTPDWISKAINPSIFDVIRS